MEKILLVLNARQPDISSIDFACRIANLAGTKLTGLFIENPYLELIPADIDGPSYFETVDKITNIAVTTDTNQSVRLFKEECQRSGINPEIYIDQGEPIQEVMFESRFADLLIIDPTISFYNRDEPLPSHFVKEILTKAECPVLLAPEEFNEFDEIVFCYDGSASSVFAIKQFTYLLPEFGNKKAMLLEVNDTSEDNFDGSHRRMMAWLRAHYHSAYYHGLKGDVKDALFRYFFKREKKWIVLGAYGRSLLSNFFRRSNADILMRIVDLPIFITHH
jgi:hypothetical protein